MGRLRRSLIAVLPGVVCALALGLIGCRELAAKYAHASEDGDATERKLRHENAALYIGTIARLSPIHRPLGDPRRGDWRSEHDEERQTFADYIEGQVGPPVVERRTVIVQPIGPLTPVQERIVRLTADFLGRFFDVPVRVARPIGVAPAPKWALRNNRYGEPQLHTRWLLNDVLPARLPADAAAIIGLTAQDLWPGKGWAYVFGQATFKRRVGVWSLYRLGSPELGTLNFQATLVRTIKVAAHELGHVFGIRHCTAWKCLMNGSHDRDEMDRHPLALCPDDVAKLTWATGANPLRRFRALKSFASENSLWPEARAYSWAIRMLASEDPAERPL